MIKAETKLRVRYGETDQMGVVYYGNYAQYLEMGRVEWLRSLGISYKSMEEKNWFVPIPQDLLMIQRKSILLLIKKYLQ